MIRKMSLYLLLSLFMLLVSYALQESEVNWIHHDFNWENTEETEQSSANK